MADLYKGIEGSPITYLAADISANQTTISIADDSALPDAPNICTIGYGEHLETIKYENKSNGVLQNVTRGIEGTPRAWQAGTEVARFFTAYDHNAIIDDFVAHKADYASLFTDNADAKNSIYRGKYLGNTVTAEQYTAISSGTFTDLYIGDYWTIEGVNWRIAAFNYYRNTGDTNVSGNHITIVPDTQLYTHVMNDTNTTTGGYIGSKMYTEGLEQAKTIIRGIFGAHLVKHRQILSNATVDGKASGWAWLDSEVELMNEIMVYGASVFGAGNLGGGSGHNIGVGKSQLPLFRLNPRMINTRQNYWLRDVVSASYFAYVVSNGGAAYGGAGTAREVRPAFSIS
jgi:hypothetical protein